MNESVPSSKSQVSNPTSHIPRPDKADKKSRVQSAKEAPGEQPLPVSCLGGQAAKMRCNSTWAGLTLEQRETLEGWLFEENLGYGEVLERVQREFGVTASKPGLSRYYQRLAAERAQRELLDLKSAVAELREIGVDR